MTSTERPRTGSAAQRAYEHVKQAILSSSYGEGELITEGAVAADIGISRTPVREALLRLEDEGLVTLHPKRGALVASYSPEDVEDVLEARRLIEHHTAGQAYDARDALLPVLSRLHERMQIARVEADTATFTASDRAFHEAIVDAAGNRVLATMYRTMRERQTLFTSFQLRGHSERMDGALAEHEKVLAALAGEDRDAFMAVVDEHLEWSLALAREMLGGSD